MLECCVCKLGTFLVISLNLDLQVLMNDVQKAIEDQFRDVDSDNEVPDQIFERVTNVGGRGNSLSFCISMHMSIAIFRKKK